MTTSNFFFRNNIYYIRYLYTSFISVEDFSDIDIEFSEEYLQNTEKKKDTLLYLEYNTEKEKDSSIYLQENTKNIVYI